MSHQFADDTGFPIVDDTGFLIVAAVKDQSKNQLKKYMLKQKCSVKILALKNRLKVGTYLQKNSKNRAQK